MDGLKARLNASLQFRLSFALALAILVVALVAGGFSFVSAFGEAHELQDDMLRQVAALADGHRSMRDAPKIADVDSRVVVQVLGPGAAPARGGTADATGAANDAGTTAAADPNPRVALPLPAHLPDGLQTLDAAGESYRVMVRSLANDTQVVVAQRVALRDEIAYDSALRTLLPLLVLVPILLLVVADLVRKMFRPFAELASAIDRRADRDLSPIGEDHLPREVRPFVVAINRQFARVAQSIQAQQRFVADAAHELRSPLAAMSLQAERLAGTPLPAAANERLGALRAGIERGRRLLDQLLALARAQASQDSRASTPAEHAAGVSVQQVFRQVLEDLLPLAEAKSIDIGIAGKSDPCVRASESDLFTLVRNLADNAIRYTPAGGTVDLDVVAIGDRARLSVQDTGPGIPPAERERVFDPFYRVLGSGEEGSGLGLSIVKSIADRIGAELRLDGGNESTGAGLRVTVSVPIADGHDTSRPARAVERES
ncbi:MAG: ATP-binding protein [Burkholderiaceae bacterium]